MGHAQVGIDHFKRFLLIRLNLTYYSPLFYDAVETETWVGWGCNDCVALILLWHEGPGHPI